MNNCVFPANDNVVYTGQQHNVVQHPHEHIDGYFGPQQQHRELEEECDDTDEDNPPKPKYGKKTRGRVKIKMQFIHNKLRRYTTFSKRKTGIMKKAYELSTLTGTQVMLLVASETGHVYTFATKKLQPMITSESGKALIQTCLNSPESAVITQHDLENDRRMNPNGFEETELCYAVGEDEDGEPGREVNDVLINAGNITESHQEPIHVSASSIMQQVTSSASSTSMGGNTFNINTIIPPASNSDGTMGKVTNLTMQVPQSLPIPSTLSVQPSQHHTIFSTNSSHSDQSSNNIAVPNHAQPQLSDFSSDRQLQKQKDEQQQEIERLTQLNQEHQQQLQLQQLQQQLQLPQSHVMQPLSNQPSAAAHLGNQQQIMIPKSALITAVNGNAGGQGTVLYQTPQNQTLVYAASPGTAISNPLSDGTGGVAVVNIVTSQPNAYSTSQMGSIAAPTQPQYITIPITQLTNNPAMLQQVISANQDLNKKT